MKDLVIIGGKAPESINLDMTCYGRIIAADSGYDTAKRLSIVPDAVVGDFDSASSPDELIRLGFVPCPRDKDDTDTAIAVRMCGGAYDLIGGGEGRLDHTLSILAALRTIRPPERWFMLSDTIIFSSGSISFEAPSGMDLSIIALTEATVSTEGLRWDMEGTELSSRFLSQSNRMEGKRAVISSSDIVMIRFFPQDFPLVRFIRS